jgi:hypothetical protein
VLRIFPHLKIRRLRLGLNPRTWVPEGSTLTPRPPRPSRLFCHLSGTFSLCHWVQSPQPYGSQHFKSISYHSNTFKKPQEFNMNFHSHAYLRPHKFCKIPTIKCHGTGFRLLIPEAEQYLFQSTQKSALKYPGVRNAPQ